MKVRVLFLLGILILPAILLSVRDRGWRLHQKITERSYGTYPTFIYYQRYDYHYRIDNPAKVDSIGLYTNYEPTNPPTWEHNLDYHYTYDVTGNNMLSVSKFYYHLFYDDSAYAQYDEENRITLCSQVYFSGVTSGSNVQVSYTEGKITSFDWQGGGYFFKMSVDYGVDNRIAEMTKYYSNDSLQWQSTDKTTYTYSTQDTSSPSGYVDFISRNLLSQSFGPSDDLLTRIDYGMILEKRDYYYNGTYGIWTNYEITNYTYDSANRLVTRQHQSLNGYENEWYWIRYDYSYEHYHPQTLNYMTTQSCHDGIWTGINTRTYYIWEQYTANEDDVIPTVTLNLSAYPNPFASSVNIILQSKSNTPVRAWIYNIKGQLIKTLDSSKALTWDGTDTHNQTVSNGIYFIKAEQDGETVTSKVIRIR